MADPTAPHEPAVRRRPRGRALAAVVALLAVVALAVGVTVVAHRHESGGIAATPKGTVLPIGERRPAGDVHGTLLDGSAFDLGHYRGSVVLINFWGSWCGPCVTESPTLDRIYRANEASGAVILGVDVKDDEAAARAFIAHNQISYPILPDFTAKSALQLGGISARALPVTVAIDRHGRIAGNYVGPILAGDIQPVLDSLLAES
jgi:thiol-disulfide isomerase/thioredoxin